MTDDFSKFLSWETTTRDTIDFKTAYVDMAGDLVAGLLLSQIVYWHLPGKDGRSKLRVYKDGHFWIAKQRNEWWNEIRITPKQFDRACKVLVDKGLVVKSYHRFNGLRTMHVRLLPDAFMQQWDQVVEQRGNPQLTKGKDRDIPKVKTGIDQRSIPLTETTTETTRDGVGGEPVDNSSFDALLELGVEPGQARTLATDCASDLVLGWCEYARTARGVRNPAALVVSRLAGGVPAPPVQDGDLTGLCQGCYQVLHRDDLCSCGRCTECCECDDE
jgi:hypothetical protein